MNDALKIKVTSLVQYFEAAYDLMGDEWAPTPEQWKKVKQKIVELEGLLEDERECDTNVSELQTKISKLEQIVQNIQSQQFPLEAYPSAIAPAATRRPGAYKSTIEMDDGIVMPSTHSSPGSTDTDLPPSQFE